jgi:lipid-binding SYLF domain-containing protein
MKKSVFLFLVTLIALVTTARADKSDRLKELITRVESCEAILQEFQGRPETAIPSSVMAKARAIIITNQLKAGALIGVQDGYGVILVKRPNGRWSLPLLLTAGETSLGLQIGMNTIEAIYIITDDATPRMLFKNRLNIGVDAKAVAGPKFADAQKNNKALLDAPVLVYTKKAGFYAGATIKTGWLSKDDEGNKLLYSTTFNFPELVYSDWVSPIPEVLPLQQMVQRFCP